MNEHKRQNFLILTVRWPHVDEVHIQSCIEAKALVKIKSVIDLTIHIIRVVAACTFYFSFEVWILVKHCHLLLPVKLMSPIGNHFFEINGVEAILKATVF